MMKKKITWFFAKRSDEEIQLIVQMFMFVVVFCSNFFIIFSFKGPWSSYAVKASELLFVG